MLVPCLHAYGAALALAVACPGLGCMPIGAASTLASFGYVCMGAALVVAACLGRGPWMLLALALGACLWWATLALAAMCPGLGCMPMGGYLGLGYCVPWLDSMPIVSYLSLGCSLPLTLAACPFPMAGILGLGCRMPMGGCLSLGYVPMMPIGGCLGLGYCIPMRGYLGLGCMP